jgi:TonB family protein
MADRITQRSTEKALEAEGTSVYVLSKDTELVAAVTVAASGRVRMNVIWSFRELRRHVERGECKIVFLDADFFEGSPRSWIEDLCALEPMLVVLVATPHATAEIITELVDEHLVHRLVVKPATVNTTRPVLEAAVTRHKQLTDEIAAARDKIEAARGVEAVRGRVAPTVNEIPVPPNELLAMRQAAARSVPMRAERRRPLARAKTYWPAWFLPIGLVAAIVVALSLSDFGFQGSSGENANAPPEPTFAEPVEAEAPPEDQVVGRTEEAFLPDEPAPAAAPAATEADETPADPPPEPAAAVDPDAALASELLAADDEPASGEPDPEPAAAVPPAVLERESRAVATGPPSPAPAGAEPASPAPTVASSRATPSELDGLVATAWSRVRANQLLEPPGDSARDYVARATELDPGHPDVIAIRSLLAEAVAESARTALESGDLAGAESLAAEALRLGASDETLAVLDLDLAAAREVAARRSHSELLDLGVARIREDRLIEPANDNALDYLRQLRAQNPDYPGLDSAWQSLGEALTGKIEATVAAEDWAGAEALLQPLTLVASPATIERFRAEIAVRRRQAEYLRTPAAQGELNLLTAVDPVYPEEAQRSDVSGWVDVEFVVGTDGIPRGATVVAADPPVTFDEAALAAVSLYRYEPFEHDGRAYERLGRLRIRFDLR